MKYRIGYRTLKTAVGTAAAIMLAQLLGADNFTSAGILVILCIKPTKRKSFRAAWDRFLACSLAMPFSALFFELIAYHPLVIGLMLFFFIPTVVMLKAKDGIVTSSVIIMHIYAAGEITRGIFLNEFIVILVGIGVALIMNWYMPSLETKLYDYSAKIEENFKTIFLEMAKFLRTNDSDWTGKELTATAELLKEAKSLAFRDVENQLGRDENIFYDYFSIREKQFEIIQRILPLAASLPNKVEQAVIMADFIEELSGHIHSGNTAHIFMVKIRSMRRIFEEMELPKTREEFEARAGLFHMLNELERYLYMKKSFKGLKKPGKKELAN